MARRAFALVVALPLVAGCVGTASRGEGDCRTIEGAGASGNGGEDGNGGSGTPVCTVGETRPYICNVSLGVYGTQTCELDDGCPVWVDGGCKTPLVISFDGAPVGYLAGRSRAFPFDSEGRTPIDWPTARTPWLALDRDGNGSIDDGSELFGSMTEIGEGRRAVNGFEALRALDADGDGLITERDPAFGEIVLWFDGDGDRRTGAGELVPLSEAGIVSIDLRYVSDPRCDRRGRCEVERAPITFRGPSGALRTGAVVDVHLPVQR